MMGFVNNKNKEYLWNQQNNYFLVAENDLSTFFLQNKVHTNLFNESATFYHKVYKDEQLIFEAISLKIHNTFKEFQLRYQDFINDVVILETKRFHLKGWFKGYIDVPIKASFTISGQTFILQVFDKY